MRYFKSERDHTFLQKVKDKYPVIKKELLEFASDEKVTSMMGALNIMSTAKKSLTSQKVDWKVFGLFMHFALPSELIEKYQISFHGFKAEDLVNFCKYIEKNLFQETRALVSELKETNGLISAWFSIFEPGAKLGLHVNDDPYMYRAHLGIIVPEGNIGFKVGDEQIKWKEGEILVFAPTDPHTAWNLTDQRRIILILDYFRPEKDRAEMKKLEREQFNRIIAENPQSFGMRWRIHRFR